MSHLDELPADEPDEEEAPEDEENRDEDDDSTWSGKNPWDFGEEEDDVQLGVSTKSGRALPLNNAGCPALPLFNGCDVALRPLNSDHVAAINVTLRGCNACNLFNPGLKLCSINFELHKRATNAVYVPLNCKCDHVLPFHV
jgi:hypothetical protein